MKTGKMEIGPKRYLYWVEIHNNRDYYSDEINDWCLNQYGVLGSWFFNYNKICFYDERDRFIFLLRWS